MTFTQIILTLPLVIGFQIALQIKYVKKCLKNPALSGTRRTIWIIVLLLFHLAGIIAYILTFHKKANKEVSEHLHTKLDRNIADSIFLALIIGFEYYSLAILGENHGNIIVTSLLSLSFIFIISIHYLPEKEFSVLKKFIPYILIITVILQDYLSQSANFGFIVLIMVAIIIFEYNLKYIKVYFWFPLILYQLIALIKISEFQGFLTQNYIVGFLISNTITYSFVVAACYFAKRQLIQNNQLQYLMQELKDKTKELEEASIIKERNRIAREIHDTLGHSLTGAIIQLEVAKKMIHKSPDKAEQSIIKTQEITRRGFADVKRAIKALRPAGIDEESLQEGLEQLIEHTAEHYHYNVFSDIKLPEYINEEIKNSVYRITQELITNSIRHGNSTQMELTIEHQDDVLRINSLDNGEGCKVIKEGNGLRGIRERVDHLNGKVYFSSEEGKGFGVLIYIPI